MAGEISATSELARRYALALFELARDDNALDAAAADMAALERLIVGDRTLEGVLASQVVPSVEKAAALGVIAERAGLSPLVRNFVGVVATNRRAHALKAIARAFAARVAAHKGLVTAEAATAQPMSDRQLADLKAALKSAFGRDVEVQADVRPDLLGGMVVKVGSRMFDSSLKTKLAGLVAVMKGA